MIDYLFRCGYPDNVFMTISERVVVGNHINYPASPKRHGLFLVPKII